MKDLKNKFAFILGATVFLGVFYSLGPGKVWIALKGARYQFLILTSVCFVLSTYLRIYKWILMKNKIGIKMSFHEINMIFFSSKFWGMVSPMRTGEIVPVLARNDHRAAVLSIILYDRVIETFQTLSVFVPLFFLFYRVFFDVWTGYALAAVSFCVALFAFFLVSPRLGSTLMELLTVSVSILEGHGFSTPVKAYLIKVKSGMASFYGATRRYFKPAFSVTVFTLTMISWCLDMVFWVILFRAFGINVGMLKTVISVMVYSMVAALVPIPNGLGVSDLSFALVLAHGGYNGNVGGLIIVSRILNVGFTFLGYIFFNRKSRRIGSMSAVHKW